jgi:hypothetical protein
MFIIRFVFSRLTLKQQEHYVTIPRFAHFKSFEKQEAGKSFNQ